MKQRILSCGVLTLCALLFSITAHAASMPVLIQSDDGVATLTWNGGPIYPGHPAPAGVVGYRITWSKADGTQPHSFLTTQQVAQIQPLDDGVSYTATIFALDTNGTIVDTSAPVSFGTDPTRVQALRQQMTGFFDDFHQPMGAFDSRKWALAYSGCDGPDNNVAFINDQLHAHSMTSTIGGNCDRGQVVSRPRATFDFTNRTGTIAFDFDGAQSRNFWYLDLVPSLMDITGQVSIEMPGTHFAPGSMLRFNQNGQVLHLIWIGPDGVEHDIARNDFSGSFAPFDWMGIPLVTNVRRHWVLHISQSHVSVQVDGHTAIDTAIQLPFSTATVLWNGFSYNTAKDNEIDSLLHWDNFGFDGPAPSVVTHDYRAAGFGTAVALAPDTVISIPDSLAGATAARVLWTLQMPKNSFYHWAATDHVTINGQSFPMIQPVGPGTEAETVSTINPYTQVLPVPTTLLISGTNTISVQCAACGVLNIHAEFDFLPGAEPTYTQPAFMMPDMSVPQPPSARIATLNGQWSGLHGTAQENATNIHTVSGTILLGLQADQRVALIGQGKITGLMLVELDVDQKRVQAWSNSSSSPRAAFALTYSLDTTLLTNGRHEVFLWAEDLLGTPSIPDYDEATAKSQDYYPLILDVENAAPTTVAPTDTPAATDTPIPATATPTLTIAPTDTSAPPTHTPAATTPPGTAPACAGHGVIIRYGTTLLCVEGISPGDVTVTGY